MIITDKHKIGDRAKFNGKNYIIATDKNFNLYWIQEPELNVY